MSAELDAWYQNVMQDFWIYVAESLERDMMRADESGLSDLMSEGQSDD